MAWRTRDGRSVHPPVTAHRLCVAPVAGKVLVPPVTGQRHRDVIPRRSWPRSTWAPRRRPRTARRTARLSRGKTPIASGLTIISRDRYRSGRRPARVAQLVEVGLVEADREGLHRAGRRLGHEATTLLESRPPLRNAPSGHVADQVDPDRLAKRVIQRLRSSLTPAAVIGSHPQVPVADDPARRRPASTEDTKRAAAWIPRKIVAGSGPKVGEVLQKRVPIQLARNLGSAGWP